eukprot:gnl/TRDRNA2_/TRDRNA2_174252_c1_seq1.p1 gnl/TRDRNA2_/TRDRNA2_174252_c1~~gnl/TRDRNA2_/TRDRNA2_174252_c1_seq1.p1  ORF type:complete len:534 (+),score=86.40 gnl/TRDRNA2_/TRDRNA2_174252_c1_seq1:109-1710(+)
MPSRVRQKKVPALPGCSCKGALVCAVVIMQVCITFVYVITVHPVLAHLGPPTHSPARRVADSELEREMANLYQDDLPPAQAGSTVAPPPSVETPQPLSGAANVQATTAAAVPSKPMGSQAAGPPSAVSAAHSVREEAMFLLQGAALPSGPPNSVGQKVVGLEVGPRLNFGPWEMKMPVHPKVDSKFYEKMYSEGWYTPLGAGRYAVSGPYVEMSVQPRLYRGVQMPHRDKLLCGAESPEELDLKAAEGHPQHFLTPLNVPMGGWWDHFQDGVLPKLVMLLPFARDSIVVTDAWNRQTVKNIHELAKLFGVRVTTDFPKEGTPVNILWGCRFPGLHPIQFRRIRSIVLASLDLPDRRVQDVERCEVFYAKRNTPSALKGRFLSNEDQVITKLKDIFGERLWVYVYDAKEAFVDIVRRMNSVCLAVGPHGSALHNYLYAAEDAPLIEMSDGKGSTNTHQQAAVMLGRLIGSVNYGGSGGLQRPVSVDQMVDVIHAVVRKHPVLAVAPWMAWGGEGSQLYDHSRYSDKRALIGEEW